MTSKTFKSTMNDSRELEVDVIFSNPRLLIKESGNGRSGFVFAPADAPALCLAILEGAGVVHHDPEDTPYEKTERTENMGALNMSAFYLAKHVNDAGKAEFLAQEQAELEAEALELLNACRKSFLHCAPEDGFDGFDDPDRIKAKWLAVARRARELAKEATK